MARLRSFGLKAGLAFQIADDILDVTATTAALGKTAGKDAQAQADALLKRGGLYKTLVPDFPFSHRRLFEGERLTIGGRSWKVIVGYGHAPEHASLYCEASKVLIAGDMLGALVPAALAAGGKPAVAVLMRG